VEVVAVAALKSPGPVVAAGLLALLEKRETLTVLTAMVAETVFLPTPLMLGVVLALLVPALMQLPLLGVLAVTREPLLSPVLQ
jgi:hypothetical protein